MLAIGVGVSFGLTAPASADLASLIAGAKKESDLRVTLHPGIPPNSAKKIGAAFNKRYGININLKADLTGRYSGKAAKGIIEHKSSAAPSFDVMVLNEPAYIKLFNAGALVTIGGWDKMLPDGADKSASPGPIAGSGFKCCDLYWGYSYNPGKATSATKSLSVKDLGSASIGGKSAITLFASNITYALMQFDQATLLGYAKAWGKAKVKRMHPTAMAQNVSLGKFAVGGFQSTEQFLDAKNKGAKLNMALFNDFIPHGELLHGVRKGSKSPNAAKLFALWTTGKEAVKLFGEKTNLGNARYGNNEAIAIALKLASKLKVKPMSFFDSAENFKTLKFLGSKAGGKFTGQLVRAIKAGSGKGKKKK